MAFVDELKSMPIAIETAAANEQHYEVCMNVSYWRSVLDTAPVMAGGRPCAARAPPQQQRT